MVWTGRRILLLNKLNPVLQCLGEKCTLKKCIIQRVHKNIKNWEKMLFSDIMHTQ